METTENLTPFGLAKAFQYGVEDQQLLVLCVAASFRLPPAGRPVDAPLAPADEQPAPPMADVHWGEPATSSLRYAGQGVPRRSGTEVYLHGSAWAAKGRPSPAVATRVRVGNLVRRIDVIGDQIRRRPGLPPSAPKPFAHMPLRYEHSYGGTARAADGSVLAQEPRNPVGRGVYANEHDSIDTLLPNLRLPGEDLERSKWRLTPCGYGPIPGSWQPRLRFAGTFDAAWMESRLPLWPKDLDPRYFCAAAEGLSLPQPLRGGEPVVLEGFSPDGAYEFHLPACSLVAKSYFANRVERAPMPLEAVLFELEEARVTLFFRHAVSLGRGTAGHLHSRVRLLEPWEEQSS